MSINQITSGGNGATIIDSRQDVKATPANVKSSSSSGVGATSDSVTAVNANNEPQNDISVKELKSSVEQINRAIGLNNSVNLNLDHDSGKVVVQIVDNETKTVLRQIPSAEVLAIARDLEGKKGVLLNDHA